MGPRYNSAHAHAPVALLRFGTSLSHAKNLETLELPRESRQHEAKKGSRKKQRDCQAASEVTSFIHRRDFTLVLLPPVTLHVRVSVENL